MLSLILVTIARSALSCYVWLELAGYLLRVTSMGVTDVDDDYRRWFIRNSIAICMVWFCVLLIMGRGIDLIPILQAIGYVFGAECQRRSPLSNLIGGK